MSDMVDNGPDETLAKWVPVLTASLGLVGSVGAAIATAAGGLDRLVRNQPIAAIVAFSCAVLAVLCIAIAIARFGGPSLENRARRTQLYTMSFFLIAIAMLSSAIGVTLITVSKEQPTIAASVVQADGGTRLEGTVSTAGVKTNERLQIRVSGHVANNPQGIRLYEAWVGPDANGSITSTLGVALDPSVYDEVFVHAWFGESVPPCENWLGPGQTPIVGCALVSFPGARTIPSLVASWDAETTQPTISGTVRLTTLQRFSVVYVRALGRRTQAGPIQLYHEAMYAGTDAGLEETPFRFTVPADVIETCVLAMVTKPGDRVPDGCPTDENSTLVGAWVRLGTPPLNEPSSAVAPGPTATTSPPTLPPTNVP